MAQARLIRGGLSSVAVNVIVSRAVTFLGQILVARFLGPQSYGIYATAFAAFVVCYAVFNPGLEDFVIQRNKKASLWMARAELAVTVSACISATVAIIANSTLHPLESRELIYCGALIGAAHVLQATSFSDIANLRLNLSFKKIAILGIVESVSFSVISIAFTSLKPTSTSLALAFLTSNFVRKYTAYSLAKGMPKKVNSSRARWGAMMLASKSFYLTRMATEIRGNVDTLIVSAILDTRSAGIYNFATRLAIQPMRIIANAINTVLYPILIRAALEDSARIDIVKKSTRYLSYLLSAFTLIAFSLMMYAEPTFLKGRYPDVSYIFALLMIGLLFDAALWPANAACRALRENSVVSQQAWVVLTAAILLLTSGAAFFGLRGAAIGMSAAYAIGTLTFFRRATNAARLAGNLSFARDVGMPIFAMTLTLLPLPISVITQTPPIAKMASAAAALFGIALIGLLERQAVKGISKKIMGLRA